MQCACFTCSPNHSQRRRRWRLPQMFLMSIRPTTARPITTEWLSCRPSLLSTLSSSGNQQSTSVQQWRRSSLPQDWICQINRTIRQSWRPGVKHWSRFWSCLSHPQFGRPCPTVGIFRGCYHVYLDVGSNVGVQPRKLYEPHLFLDPVPPVNAVFDSLFGTPWDT